MNHDAVDALARSGCREVGLSAESGSQQGIDAMDKGITVADIRGARRRLGDRGIRARFFIQFGYPVETRTDIGSTIEFLGELLPDDIGISVSSPMPPTKFYEMVDEHRPRVAERWSALRTREPAERNPRPTRLRIPVSVLAEPPHVEPATIR